MESYEDENPWEHATIERDQAIQQLEAQLEDARREIDALREICAGAYQITGCVGAPERVLDILSDAASGELGRRRSVDELLPVDRDECDAVNEMRETIAQAFEDRANRYQSVQRYSAAEQDRNNAAFVRGVE